jgi:hypothetical protein
MLSHCKGKVPDIACTHTTSKFHKDWIIECPCGYTESFLGTTKDYAMEKWGENRWKENLEKDRRRRKER